MVSKGYVKYQRVCLRLREKFGDKGFSRRDIEDAVFIDCGTDPRTVKVAFANLERLKMIEKCEQKREFGVEPKEMWKIAQNQKEYF